MLSWKFSRKADNMKIKTDRIFTVKNKIKASIICGAAVLLWLILWKIFPMEFYSLFFASNVGSNIMLLLLILVISIPCNLLFSKITKSDISMTLTLLKDVVLMTAAAYTFSVFRYSHTWIFIIALVLHLAAEFFVTGFADEGEGVLNPPIKRKPLMTAVWSAVHIILADGLLLLIMYTMAHVFRG